MDIIGAMPQKNKQRLEAGLYIVATPIGNLRDISLRALDVLAAASIIYCEDKRVSAKLFAAYNIKTRKESYHDHNGAKVRPQILARLAAGEAVALISDAGTPIISDPGLKLVKAARAAEHAIHIIPGANAAIAAISGAGVACDRFFYLGFLPRTKIARQKSLRGVAGIAASLIIYESPHRLGGLLTDIETIFGERKICIARELTKRFETFYYGTAAELLRELKKNPLKGEMVVLIEAASAAASAISEEDMRAALKENSLRDAAKLLSEESGNPRRDVYKNLLEFKKDE